MCGIAGYVDFGKPTQRSIVERMTAVLRARGPDDEGYYVAGPAALGHRRLRVIDLEGGAQPMTNAQGTVTVVFNGEIYNFATLRSEFEARGRRFSTRSDTEVILHAYEEFGEACVEKFNGMFAFAIWDHTRQSLFLARDRFGEKPLYYSTDADALAFASEPKALLAGGFASAELSFLALRRYLAHEYVPNPDCMFQGVKKLPPATSLTFERGKVRVTRYWKPAFSPVLQADEAAIADELVRRLRESVRLRLVSDVPLGVFLSGGLDSSALVSVLADIVPNERIKTFSIGFEDDSFDESGYAEMVARHFATDHSTFRLQGRELADAVTGIIPYMDEPLADASLLPTYLLARQTREHVTVALGGDGGDELFSGYPTFGADRVAELYAKMPAVLRTGLARLIDRLPVSHGYMSFDFKAKQFLRGAALPRPARHQAWLGSFTGDEQEQLLTGAVKAQAPADPADTLLKLALGFTGKTGIDLMTEQYLSTYLTDDILVKVDRAAMAVSLETRAPFLDHTFADFALSIPAGLRLKGLHSKYILRKAFQNRLPPPILSRAKKGFAVPVSRLLAGELRPVVDELLAPGRLRREGLFNPEYVDTLLREHRANRRDHRKKIWTLLMFQLWKSHYTERQPHVS